MLWEKRTCPDDSRLGVQRDEMECRRPVDKRAAQDDKAWCATRFHMYRGPHPVSCGHFTSL